MLTQLRIENFAIIDSLELQFESGLVVFTGETGAGKSIIIDAVEIILGGRVDHTMIRAGEARAVVEGEFHIPEGVRKPVHDILQREDLLDDLEYLTLGREVRSRGRNVARVNGRSVSLSLLRELGEYLVDVHGQSEHLSLLRVREHVRLLDSFADAGVPKRAYRETYHKLQQVRREITELTKSNRDAARRADLLSYQIDEIDIAALEPGEETRLKQERNRLANVENLTSSAQEALAALDEGDPDRQSVTDSMAIVLKAMEMIAKTDDSRRDLLAKTQSLYEEIADIAIELRDYLDEVEFDPDRLEEVEERLILIANLKRKYGNTIEEILAFREKIQADLDAITFAETRLGTLQKEEKTLRKQIAIDGQALSRARETASTTMSTRIEAELAHLRMEQARFQVERQIRPDPNGVELASGERVAFDANGLETVQFLVAPNPGEGFKPLAKVASGGEMSRLMLAMKNVLAQADLTPTLIFDEIDQGIGGRVGAIVGQKLWQLARVHQVLCITHLPQLAAYGNQHYRVKKKIDDGRTSTALETLEGAVRVNELAQMLGTVSEGTIRSAQEILDAVSQMEG